MLAQLDLTVNAKNAERKAQSINDPIATFFAENTFKNFIETFQSFKFQRENKMIDVTKIIRWENGEMNPEETLEFFSELIKTGDINHLQGIYGRTAENYIKTGFLDRRGNILRRFGENEG